MIRLMPFVLAVTFFTAAFFTLPDYNISWDETLHFYRGQAYLHYFLTGQTTYEGIPKVDLQGTNGDPGMVAVPRRSFYQSDLYNGEFMLRNDSGHPPLNGEMAALLNYIFYQKLGILDDVSSHHLFNILASTLLIFVVVFFAVQILGLFGGVISFFALATYPLFWAESHFNIKDPPEAAFFAATIWAFFNSLKSYDPKWLLAAILFFSFGLGTKFNILFLPLILGPYLLIRYHHFLTNPLNIFRSIIPTRGYPDCKVMGSLIPKRYLLTLLMGPPIVAVIFFGTWPYLWQNFPLNLFNIFNYYKEIGTGYRYQSEVFYILGFNTFPLLWILSTTPPVVLFLTFIGIISSVVNIRKEKFVLFLWLLWLSVPVVRVTLPGTTIYGGIRQIMEFIPAMALLSALGAWQIVQWAKKIYTTNAERMRLLIVLLFLWPIFILIKMHPQENVYFNFLMGGLSGAKEKHFPSWGNSFGNAYLSGVKWVNQNAEFGAKLSLIQGTATNAPAIFLRGDIDYKSGNWSGITRGGEYLMELTFNDSARDFNYAWAYVEKFLVPVYELKVEGVPILKIWKNDPEHTKESARKNEIELFGPTRVIKEDNKIVIDLGKVAAISRVYLHFDSLSDCHAVKTAFVGLSRDNSFWIMEKDLIPFRQVGQKENINDNTIEYWIAGDEARYIRFIFENNKVCPLNYTSAKVLVLE